MIPSFVARVERPGRGDVWVDYLSERRAAERRWTERLGLDRDDDAEARSSVELVHVDGDEDRLLAALLFEAAGDAGGADAGRGRGARATSRARMLADLVGERTQPPPPPGPRLRGAALPLRDRLRLRRVPRPPAPPDADRPVAAADARTSAPRSPRRSPRPGAAISTSARSSARAASTSACATPATAEAAPYALCLGYRIRYVLDLNAREAMHLTELRSAPRGPRRATARSPRRCTPRSPSVTRPSPRR